MLGSSPLMRGIHYTQAKILIKYRIIPAHAGNTLPCLVSDRAGQDHPRSCGEYKPIGTCGCTKRGSSPLMRGIRPRISMTFTAARIIPAHAGNTSNFPFSRFFQKDHPRSCGEYHDWSRQTCHHRGSSPLMRGIHPDPSQSNTAPRIIPAHAGNTMQRQSKNRK